MGVQYVLLDVREVVATTTGATTWLVHSSKENKWVQNENEKKGEEHTKKENADILYILVFFDMENEGI